MQNLPLLKKTTKFTSSASIARALQSPSVTPRQATLYASLKQKIIINNSLNKSTILFCIYITVSSKSIHVAHQVAGLFELVLLFEMFVWLLKINVTSNYYYYDETTFEFADLVGVNFEKYT